MHAASLRSLQRERGGGADSSGRGGGQERGGQGDGVILRVGQSLGRKQFGFHVGHRSGTVSVLTMLGRYPFGMDENRSSCVAQFVRKMMSLHRAGAGSSAEIWC